MNDQPNYADFTLAMYATACESHMRRDWREACHALAKALKAEQMASASRATINTAAPMPEPVAPDVYRKAPKSNTSAKRVKASAGAAESFNMTAGSLTRAMRLVCRAVEKRNSQPILDNVYIEALGAAVRISGTDLDRVVTVLIDAPGIGTWATTAGGHALLAMLAKADKAAPVTLAGGGKGTPPLTVTIGRAVSTLPTLPVSDFPKMLDGVTWDQLDIDGPALISALAFVAPAMSTEETRFYLNGAFLGVRPVDGVRRLHVVTTDGHRCHKAEIDAPTCAALDLAKQTEETRFYLNGAILPRKSVLDLLAIAGDGEGLTFALAGEAGYQVTRGPVTLTSKLIDGSFPDYMRVIPTDSKFTVRADREELSAKVAGVASVSKVKGGASVRLTAEGAALALQCRDLEGGKADDVLEVDYTEAPPKGEEAVTSREWGMNALYIRDALASLSGDVVAFAGTAPSDPFKLTGADFSRLVVLLPLRV